MILKNKTIIAIDDTHSILTFLRISLEALGATFHGTTTASGGLAMCETANPDLVLLDLGLPDKEGLEILPRLKRLRKEKNLPVIVLTVRKEREDREAAEKMGADAYLTKPFILDELINMILLKLNISPEPSVKLVKSDTVSA